MNITKDLKKLLEESGWSMSLLARHAKVDYKSISRLLNQEESDSVIDKLIPFIYGDKRPPALPKKHQKPKK